MASNTNPTVKKVTAETQTINSFEALLKTNNIFLFIPNIIGYVRVFLSIVSFYFMPSHPKITIFCYLTSEFLDALDGHAARALGQNFP
ncbi:unnamed protein product [Rotaria sp. Silwood1]|nr:unnamed protein product [Rotaria sp. Silwood1]